MPDYSRYALGARPSPPDPRDYRVQALGPTAADKLPPIVLLGSMPPVYDQGPEGSCVGQAMRGLLAYHLLTQPNRQAPYGRDPSSRDAYEGARLVEPLPGEGAYPRAAMKWAHQTGVCLDATWAYEAGRKGQAGATAAAERPLNRIGSYAQVAGIVEIRAALHFRQGPIFTVAPVTDGFYTPDAEGRVKHVGPERGHHAILITGYDQAKAAWRIRNSWGTGWGEGGYAWLPYAHPVTEAWTVTPLLSAPQLAPPIPWWEQAARWLGGL